MLAFDQVWQQCLAQRFKSFSSLCVCVLMHYFGWCKQHWSVAGNDISALKSVPTAVYCFLKGADKSIPGLEVMSLTCVCARAHTGVYVLHVCMCAPPVYMCVCMRVCVCVGGGGVHVCGCVHVCTWMHAYVCTQLRACTSAHTYTTSWWFPGRKSARHKKFVRQPNTPGMEVPVTRPSWKRHCMIPEAAMIIMMYWQA